MTAATAHKPAGRPAGGRSKLDKIATFRRVEEGVRCPVLVECGELAEQLNDAAAWPVVGLWGGEWRSHVGTESIRTAGPVPDPAGEPVAAGAA